MKYSLIVGSGLLMVCLGNLYMHEELSGSYTTSELSWSLSVLILLSLLMVLYERGKMIVSPAVTTLVPSLTVMVNSSVVPLIHYESLFILIMFSILVLGHSFERLVAGFMMMFYPFLFSSPTLIFLIMMDNQSLSMESLEHSLTTSYYIVRSFIVKFPILSLHYWLPVAHVEASTPGSIILAGILPKTGGLGVWYVAKFSKPMVKSHWSLLGYSSMMMVILFTSDLKTTVAYSSVAHTSFLSYATMLGPMVGINGSVLTMFYHGIISSSMPWVTGVSAWVKTRPLTVTKLVSSSSFFMGSVLVLLIPNMGFPPSMGLMSEILTPKSVFVMGCVVSSLSMVGALLSCSYNISLHRGPNGVEGSHSLVEMKFSNVLVFLSFVMLFVNYY